MRREDPWFDEVYQKYSPQLLKAAAVLLDDEWLAEEIVRQYSDSLYIEAAARNRRAIALYHRLGYQCLNTVTVRKDFPGYAYEVQRDERIYDLPFEIRASRQTREETP